MANVVKKYSISYDLAQKMADAAVAKARELGVSENVAILDDGGNLKAFSRMDGAPVLSIEMAQLYPERPVAFGGHPYARACGGVGRRVSH